MRLEEVEPAPDAGQHAERQHVDLHQAERVDVVLVPFDEGAVLHGGVADRHGLVEPVAGEHEAADMLREMAREADELVGERDGLPDRRVVRIEPGLADVGVGQAVALAPDRVGERRGDVGRQAERLADLADRPARAVMDHGGADRGAIAAVALGRGTGSPPRAARARNRRRCRAARCAARR